MQGRLYRHTDNEKYCVSCLYRMYLVHVKTQKVKLLVRRHTQVIPQGSEVECSVSLNFRVHDRNIGHVMNRL